MRDYILTSTLLTVYLLSVVSVDPVRAPFPLGQCDAVYVVAFQLEQTISSQPMCVMPFLGACISLLDVDGEMPSLLKQHFFLVDMNVSNSCPQMGTGVHMQRETFFPNLGNFSSRLYTGRSALILVLK